MQKLLRLTDFKTGKPVYIDMEKIEIIEPKIKDKKIPMPEHRDNENPESSYEIFATGGLHIASVSYTIVKTTSNFIKVSEGTEEIYNKIQKIIGY